MSAASKSLLSSALAESCGLTASLGSLSATSSHMSQSPGQGSMEQGAPLLMSGGAPNSTSAVPPQCRRGSSSDTLLDFSYPSGLSRLVLDRRASSCSGFAGEGSVSSTLHGSLPACSTTSSADTAFTNGTRQGKLERVQVETICRFLVSTASLVHTLQAERGARCPHALCRAGHRPCSPTRPRDRDIV